MPLKFIRYASFNAGRKRVSIVGSGPSGFYTAYHLLTKSSVPLHITMWEKLPVPFGLSRYGIAPDHPEVKNCEDTFMRCAEEFSQPGQKHQFDFVGGITIGDKILLSDLLHKEDAVILSYGCAGDKKLGIPGENDTKGVFSSREFVNWYNGHPDYAMDPKFTDFDWSQVKKVGIIGNGNVALDLTRVLISNSVGGLWGPTDISPVALNCLTKAPVRDVKLIARRDFNHSKFTNKELRELWELEKYGIHGKIDPKYFQADMYDLATIKDRAFKRRVEMCSEYLKPFDQRTKKNYKKFVPPLISASDSKIWELDYLKSPLKINCDDGGKIKSLTLCRNNITEDNRVIALKDEKITYDLELLITSLGYSGKPLPEFSKLGVQFQKDHIANEAGRVLDVEGSVYPKLYASGWIRKGSEGVIASTMMDAFNVADIVINDLSAKSATLNNNVSTATTETFDLSGIRHTTWRDWKRINESELKLGKIQNKARVKYLKSEDMLSYSKIN